MAKFIMLIGLPGSGKSTYAQRLLDTDGSVKHFSSDKIREELYGNENIQGDPNKIFRIMHQRVKESLDKGYDVVYDATNVTRKNRRGILNELKGCTKEAHIVWAPYEECVERDKQRKRSVGEDVIRKFLLRWNSPYYDEGFNIIKLVHNESVGFNTDKYKADLISNMKIPHDNPHHRLSVWEHSLAAYTYVKSHTFDELMRNAAMYHDIGKPLTKSYKSDENGKLIPVAHYYQHDCVGGYLVYGFDDHDTSGILLMSWLVCNHMQPYFMSNYYKSLPVHLKTLVDFLHETDVAAH